MGAALYGRVSEIIESARRNAARSVDTAQVISNWLIGREIVKEEQRGKKRAEYGKKILKGLAGRLLVDYGKGYSFQNLKFFRQFFVCFPGLLEENKIRFPVGSESPPIPYEPIRYPPGSELRHPGRLNANLSWRHYRSLMRVSDLGARGFYEIEAVKNAWSGRELERQINSLLYERLALSKDKAGLMKLATKGHDVRRPEDAFKDPVVMEFLGLPESPKLAESNLEGALIDNLRGFLLELGNGFAFVSRQQRLSLDGDHFYVDLVFYDAVLKCYVLVDLKVGKLTHQDLGQMQLYVNYYDSERRTKGDGPTLGLILCTDKNDAVVRYTLGTNRAKIFASRYKLYLPTEAELAAELRRELSDLHSAADC
ncbi:MAG: DUF1016 domain-containing protein [Elusimicrobia bacterium]|nr:DUF1016 domain-containing protein [Elusimicrobiota bacterium]